ncbi:MAG TPA: aminotransferase class V-fold PLP-dependent enzyme, partial [Candidatus Hydrogenedentes bacterium]|nr:aminotransferase class V-fold PLP-dependent enzyme [Candidatus Hydrogenedentota bacterium]
LLKLHALLAGELQKFGFQGILKKMGVSSEGTSGILTVTHPDKDMKALFKHLDTNGVTASLRQDRAGTFYIRFSPHFYNTEADVMRIGELLSA